jgi:3-oxoacyl-[acyl-carrier protein] reductase
MGRLKSLARLSRHCPKKISHAKKKEIKNMGLLDGKVAIITGSGRGIGAATGKLFASEGASVVICDLDAGPAEETTQAIREKGSKAITVVGDVTSPEFPAQLIQATMDNFGGFDIIVNNAGYSWDAVIQNMSDAQWNAMLDIHLSAPFRILREASRYIRETAKNEQATKGYITPRKIVNITSITGVHGNPGQVNYAAAKAGIVGLTKTLAKEWGRYNVQVNCACFGFIETRMTAPKGSVESLQRNGETVSLGIPEQMRQKVVEMIPLGRPGTAEEAANAILFLASPMANYITGQVLEVTGGSDL